MTMLRKFVKEEEGLELVEYAVMTALIVATIVGAITFLSGAISDRMVDVQGVIDGIGT